MSESEAPEKMRIATLGRIDFDGAPGAVEPLLAQPKRIALLLYLLLAKPRGLHRRDKLVTLFWPELTDEAARNSLSQALHTLRRTLGPDAIVTRGAQEVGVAADRMECDAIRFEELLDAGDRESAVLLYQGPFLAAFHVTQANGFEEWAELERMRLRDRFHEALETLCDTAETGGNWRAAVSWRKSLFTSDPLNGRYCAALIRCLGVAGERAAALKLAEEFKQRFQEEMGTDPDDQVSRAAESAGKLPALRLQPAPPAPTALPAPTAISGNEPRVPSIGKSSRRVRSILATGGLITGLVGVGTFWQLAARTGGTNPVTAEQVTFTGDVTAVAATSDGQWIAYVRSADSGTRLMVMDRVSRSSTEIYASGRPLYVIDWSPDGTRLSAGTVAPSRVLVFRRLGGPPDELNAFFGSSWLLEDYLVSWGVNWKGVRFRSFSMDRYAPYVLQFADTLPWMLAFGIHPDGKSFYYARGGDKGYTRAYGFRVDSLSSLLRDTATAETPDTLRGEWTLVEGPTVNVPIELTPHGDRLYFTKSESGYDLQLWSIPLRSGLKPDGPPQMVSANMEIFSPYSASPTFVPVAGSQAYYVRGRRTGQILALDSVHAPTARRITSGTAIYSSVALSPDGNQVAYIETKEGQTTLQIARFIDGQLSQHRVIDSLGSTPAWSPDGSRLAVAQVTPGGERILLLNAADLAADPLIVEAPAAGISHLEWQPGHDLLATSVQSNAGSLFRFPADSSGPIQLISSDSNRVGWMLNARYSPDGRRVGFHWNRGNPTLSGLYVLSLETGRFTRQVPGAFQMVGWSADGGSLFAFQQGVWRLTRYPLDGSPSEQLPLTGLGGLAVGHSSGGRVVLHQDGFIGDIWLLKGLPHR